MRTGRMDDGRRAVRPRTHAAFVEHVVVLRGLAGGGAERGADLHGGDLAVSIALRPAAVLGVIFFSETNIEHGAELDVVGAAARGDDNALARPDVDRLFLVLEIVVDLDRRDAGDAARQRLLAMDLGHPVLQQNLDAHLARGRRQGPHEARPATWAGHLVRPRHDVEPRAGAVEAVRDAAIAFPFDTVLLQPIEQVEIVVGIGAHQCAVAEAADGLFRPRPVGEHEIGRIVAAGLLLQAIATANIEAAEAHHGAAADVEIHLDHDHRGAFLACRDRGRKPAGPGADDHDVRLAVPADLLGLRGGGRDCGCRPGNSGARGQEAAAVDRSKRLIGSLAGDVFARLRHLWVSSRWLAALFGKSLGARSSRVNQAWPGSPAGARATAGRPAPHFAAAQCGLRYCSLSRMARKGMTGGAAEQTGEDEIIARYFRPLAKHPAAFGLIDDCAALLVPAGRDLVLKTDAIVGGVHFFAEDPADKVAHKALRVNLSDLAAKGAKPEGCLLALALPKEIDRDWLKAFARGLGKDADAYGCPLLGGDTDRTSGPVTIAITAFGTLPRGSMVLRGGAKPDDRVFVTGAIGDAALGLALRQDDTAAGRWNLSRREIKHLAERYLVP